MKRSPCVLNTVECGFLTNPGGVQSLTQEEYQDKVAGAVADGVEAEF
ncbi:MAG: N-acetylmuramoyl-L-alanine amidase [Blautia sp.]